MASGNASIHPVLTRDMFWRIPSKGYEQRLFACGVLSVIGIFASFLFLAILYYKTRKEQGENRSLASFFWLFKRTNSNLTSAPVLDTRGARSLKSGYIVTNSRVLFPICNILCYGATIGLMFNLHGLFSTRHDAEGILYVKPAYNEGRTIWFGVALIVFATTMWLWVFGLFTNFLWVAAKDTNGRYAPPWLVNTLFLGGGGLISLASLVTGVVSIQLGLKTVHKWTMLKDGLLAVHRDRSVILRRPGLMQELTQLGQDIEKILPIAQKSTAAMTFSISVGWTFLLILAVRSLSITFVLGRHIKEKFDLIHGGVDPSYKQGTGEREQISESPSDVVEQDSTYPPNRDRGPNRGRNPANNQVKIIRKLVRTRRDFLLIGITAAVSLSASLMSTYGAGIISLQSSKQTVGWDILEFVTCGAIYIYVLTTLSVTLVILLGTVLNSRSLSFMPSAQYNTTGEGSGKQSKIVSNLSVDQEARQRGILAERVQVVYLEQGPENTSETFTKEQGQIEESNVNETIAIDFKPRDVGDEKFSV